MRRQRVDQRLGGAFHHDVAAMGRGQEAFDEHMVDEGHEGLEIPVPYTQLRAHQIPEQIVCRILLETKK